ncbi:MAG TPA: radical SAM protein [Bacillota bacterium]|nr:radical SAM protein [Bacillota bacterium]
MGQDRLGKVRVSAGTASVLGLSPIASFDEPTCAYVMIGERCTRDCAFCAQARSSAAPGDRLSRVTWPEFSADDLAQALGAAAGEGKVQRACAQVVGTPGAFEKAIAAVNLLKSAVGPDVPVSVSYSATARIEQVEALMEAGAERVALPIDACNDQLYRDIKGGHDMSRALSLIGECARRFPGRVSTHLIAGLGETEEEIISLAASMYQEGVTVGLFAFTPLPGTRLAHRHPPDLSSYRRIQLCCYLLKRAYMEQPAEGPPGFQFSSGRLTGISLRLSVARVGARWGEAFQTSGCPGCNRPYYNERPGQIPYNYPRPLTPAESADAVAAALNGLELEGARPADTGLTQRESASTERRPAR